MKLIRKIGKRILSSPLLRNYWYKYDAKLAEHLVPIADTRITLFAPKKVVEIYNNDTREGHLTGVDKEGRYEHAFAMKFRDAIHPNTILFDVGAHYGLYSILAFQIMKPAKPGQIVSFEPHPFNSWVLRRNNRVYCKSYLTIKNRKIGDNTQKKFFSLDTYYKKTGIAPTLVKMDIEGFEYFAIQGMERICKEIMPVIFVEFHVRLMRNLFHVDPEKIIKLLESWNYRLRYNGHHWYTVQHTGEVDSNWHEAPPNDINFGIWAECNSK